VFIIKNILPSSFKLLITYQLTGLTVNKNASNQSIQTKWGLLPGQIIFEGKTQACIPKVPNKYEKIVYAIFIYLFIYFYQIILSYK
jgi:hypothetical protein